MISILVWFMNYDDLPYNFGFKSTFQSPKILFPCLVYSVVHNSGGCTVAGEGGKGSDMFCQCDRR